MMHSRTLRRCALWLAVSGATLFIGGCSISGIGAELLSGFLRSGGTSSLGSALTSLAT